MYWDVLCLAIHYTFLLLVCPRWDRYCFITGCRNFGTYYSISGHTLTIWLIIIFIRSPFSFHLSKKSRIEERFMSTNLRAHERNHEKRMYPNLQLGVNKHQTLQTLLYTHLSSCLCKFGECTCRKPRLPWSSSLSTRQQGDGVV